MNNVNKELLSALIEASDHLDYCGYGDSYERECARDSNLEATIEVAISNAQTELGEEDDKR